MSVTLPVISSADLLSRAGQFSSSSPDSGYSAKKDSSDWQKIHCRGIHNEKYFKTVSLNAVLFMYISSLWIIKLRVP